MKVEYIMITYLYLMANTSLKSIKMFSDEIKKQKPYITRILVHSYPHSWRSKAPLVYKNTSQWFISMDTNDLRQKALKAIDETDFFPKQGQKRLRSMIQDRPDWCVSRQRVWGVPLPIFVNKKQVNLYAIKISLKKLQRFMN